MPFHAEGAHLTLWGGLTIEDAPALQAQLLSLLCQETLPIVTLHAEGVESVDFAIVQLLLSAQLSWESAGKRLRIVAPSAALRRAQESAALFLRTTRLDSSRSRR